MRGLMLKDFKLMQNQKKMMLIIFIITVLFSVTGENLSFILSYSSMLAAFMAVGTISYDEYDNGYAFLFTLPVTRKGYVAEKYVFSLAASSVVWALMVLVGMVLGSGDSLREWLLGSAGILAALYLMMFFMIPIRLKFGAERGRIATIVIIIGFMSVISGLNKLQETMNFTVHAEWIKKLPVSVGIAAGIFLILLLGVVSLLISYRIVEKKEL